MNSLQWRFLVLLSALPLASAWAQGWRNVPPEERAQMRQEMRQQWRQESPEQGMPARFEAPDNRRAWRDLPAEERQRLRQDVREHGHRHGGRGPRDD